MPFDADKGCSHAVRCASKADDVSQHFPDEATILTPRPSQCPMNTVLALMCGLSMSTAEETCSIVCFVSSVIGGRY